MIHARRTSPDSPSRVIASVSTPVRNPPHTISRSASADPGTGPSFAGGAGGKTYPSWLRRAALSIGSTGPVSPSVVVTGSVVPGPGSSADDEHAPTTSATAIMIVANGRDIGSTLCGFRRQLDGCDGDAPHHLANLAIVSEAPRLATPQIHPTAFVADTARIHGAVTIGAQASIWFGAVIRCEEAHITIGARTNIQDNAVLHADLGQPTELGDEVTVGHGAIVHAALVGDQALIGMGAVVLNGATIGRRAMIAAGSVVAPGTVIEDGMLAIGSPARPSRPIRDSEWESTWRGVGNYLRFADMYRAGLDGD